MTKSLSPKDLETLNRIYKDRLGYSYDEMESFTLPNYAESNQGIQLKSKKGFTIRVHPKGHCKNPEACVIHHPSNHSMKDFPLNWRADRGMMERICPHGVGHPDPDDVAFHKAIDSKDSYYSTHGCDGCCISPSDVDDD